MQFPAVKQKTAHQTALEALRRAILSAQIAPGERLVQTEIAQQLGLSITPVREAMRQLATEGLLRFDSYRGAVVHTASQEEFAEAFEIASALMPMVATKALANATDHERAQLRAAYTRMLDAGEDLPTWIEANEEFHLVLYRAAHSPRAESILMAIGNLATPLVAQYLRANADYIVRSNDEHAEILRAFEAGDAERLIAANVLHLDLSLRPHLGEASADSTDADR